MEREKKSIYSSQGMGDRILEGDVRESQPIFNEILLSHYPQQMRIVEEMLPATPDQTSARERDWHETSRCSATRKLQVKGVWPDNRCIAVKRLFFNARQDVNEFYNEVYLISQVKHKNLVTLLGCSVDGPERLLVYEYLPNKSLDQFLFDPTKSKALDWRKRFDIILGTARGLAYLHQESEIRIIHRDIKASNIMLDENLAPKIAGFGLARFFAEDESHLSTGVAGTLGYMAPEYVMHGQLTEKADIFSFGVLVLEIVSGRKNNMGVSEEDMLPLLDTTWKHYEAGTISEIVNREFNQQEEEVCRVVQIALLCTQSSPQLRPLMSEIVAMLTSKDSTLPLPTQPAFIDLNNSDLVKPVVKVANEDLNSSTPLSINDPTER